MRSLELPRKVIIITTSLLLITSTWNSSNAFLPTSFVTRSTNNNGLDTYRSTVNILFHTTNDINTEESIPSSTSSRRKRRIRKKDDALSVETEGIESSQDNSLEITSEQPVVEEATTQQQPSQESTTTTEATISLKPRKESRVAMKVRDVREVTNIGIVESTSSDSISDNTFLSSLPFFNKSDRDNKQQLTTTTTTASTKSISGDDDTIDYDTMDPIQRLLYDAKQMQNEEESDDSGRKKLTSSTDDDNDGSIGSRIRSVISTIVTVDFFVVCGFLLWFLAGIFASVVLKDDTIQIAFNSNFQQLVQPALGILMIAALADAVFKNKDDEEG